MSLVSLRIARSILHRCSVILALSISMVSCPKFGLTQENSEDLQATLTPSKLIDRIEIMRKRIRTGDLLVQFSRVEQDGEKKLPPFQLRFPAKFDLTEANVLETNFGRYALDGDADVLDVRSFGIAPMRTPPGGRMLSAATSAWREQIKTEQPKLEFMEDRRYVWLECSNDQARTRWKVDLEQGFTIVERLSERGRWDAERRVFTPSDRLDETKIQWERISNIWLPTLCKSKFVFTYKPFGPPDEPLRSRITRIDAVFLWKSVNEPVAFGHRAPEGLIPFEVDVEQEDNVEPIK